MATSHFLQTTPDIEQLVRLWTEHMYLNGIATDSM